MAIAALVVGFGLSYGTRTTAPTTAAPSTWQPLGVDAAGECGPDTGRDVRSTWYAAESGLLHLRMCTGDGAGWPSGPDGPVDARYKWMLKTTTDAYLIVVEDAEVDPSDPARLASDGAGEVTLLDDPDGDGRFGEWAGGQPPAYIGNDLGSRIWRRSWSNTAGSRQSSTAGHTGDVGFSLGTASCGAVVDVYVRTALLGSPSDVCLSWATDAESSNLDERTHCDSGSGGCVPLGGPPSSPTLPPGPGPIDPTASPTRTSPPGPGPVTATYTPTALPTHTAQPAIPSATPKPTETPLPSPTRTPTSIPPSATPVPPSATPWPTPTDVPPSSTPWPTWTPSDVPPSGTPPPTWTPTDVPPSATPWPTWTPTDVQPSATPLATWTPSVVPPSATALPTWTPSPTWDVLAATAHAATATAKAATAQWATATALAPTVTAVPPWPGVHTPTPPPWPGVLTPSPTPTGPTPIASATPTSISGLGGAVVCVNAVINGQVLPFPDPATVNMVLLTPLGWPAEPARTRPLGRDSCARYHNLTPGQYRVWVSVPPTWTYYPGTPPSQTMWVLAGMIVPPQCVFRFMPVICLPCPPGGAVPTPPGPPGGIPSPPGPPTMAPYMPTPTPPGGIPFPPGPPTAYPNSPDRPFVGAVVQLPVLGFLGNDPVCSPWVEAQNVGDRPAKALLIVWGAPGFCPPQAAGPLKVECSGLLAPGSAWNFLGGQMPAAARSGVVISANVDDIGGDVFADALCEALFFRTVGNADEYRRFRKAFDEHGVWNGFDFGRSPNQPLAVEVLRSCPGDLRPDVKVTASYAGIAGEFLGHYDPVYGGFAYFAPALYAGHGGFSSVMYIQNAGLECTSVELWLKAFDNCLRPRVCDILTLAPGESHAFDASSCMPAGWVGGAWIRASQPLAVAVDHVGNDVLMTYNAQAGELNYVHNGQPLYTTGSGVAFGPLVYSEFQGWDSSVVVQNLSRTVAAKVKVYFLDRSGDVITTLVDWVCPQGSQAFFLPVIANLPGNWVGSVRVESQDWFAAGGPSVSAPNVHAVAHLLQYSDIARSDVQEAIAYNLFPEQLAYDWQLGSGGGGTRSGVGRIGIPSFLKDQRGTGVTSEIAIANIVPKPGLTNFALFIYDQNGLIDYLCETLHEQQVEYIDLANWGFINPGFKGSAVISATFWEHDVFDPYGRFTRNVVGLAAVKVERTGTVLGNPIPGDESAGNEAFPIPGPFRFAGPNAPGCPGQPSGSPPPGGVPTPPGPPRFP